MFEAEVANVADSACSRPQRIWGARRNEHGVEVCARQLCRYVCAPGMRRLAPCRQGG